jgi:hypothetical protein
MHGLVQQTSPLSTTTRIDQVSDSALLSSKSLICTCSQFGLAYAVLLFSSRIACYQDVSRRP